MSAIARIAPTQTSQPIGRREESRVSAMNVHPLH
jgi:hypothetical protein